MNRHSITLANLADWVDGRLDAEAQQRVQAHLATGCPACQRDLACLQRVITAARTDQMVEPPGESVARVKDLYRSRFLRPAPQPRRLQLFRSPRLVLALAATLIVVLSAAFYMSQVPTLFAREAVLAALQGTVEARGAGDIQWQSLREGARLGEGDQVRVAVGVAVLTLFDGSTLEMQPGTELALTSLRSGLFGAAYQVGLDQQAGSVDYDVAPLRGSLSSFEAHSPTVRVAVRGTRFVITVETVEETRVTVLQGSVQVQSAVETTVLMEREVAIVPADAPLVLLPTLTPTATPTPGVVATEARSPKPTDTLAGPVSTAVPPTAPIEPTAVPQPTQTLWPSATPTAEAALAVTPTVKITKTPRTTATPVPLATVGADKVEFQGAIERFPPHILGVWRIGGRRVLVKRTTRIIGRPAVGLQATVTCLVPTVPEVAQRVLVALQIEIEAPQLGQTVEPSSTSWWGTLLTPTPQPTDTAGPSPTPTATPTPQPAETSKPSRTPRATRTPRLTRTPRPTESSPTSTPTGLPSPTSTLEPTVTLSPLATPETQNIQFAGVIERLPPIRLGPWVIGGRMVIVTANTQVEGTPAVGLQAEVEAVEHVNVAIQAIRITIKG